MKIKILAAFAAMAVSVLTTGLSTTSVHASAAAARALERLEGMREGTRRANKIMGVNTRRVPWCGYAVKYAVRKAGKKPAAAFASARAWESWGKGVRLSAIKRGDVAIFRSKYSKSGRHVAIITAVKGNKVKVCGGNTRNRVHCGWRSKKRITKVRR